MKPATRESRSRARGSSLPQRHNHGHPEQPSRGRALRSSVAHAAAVLGIFAISPAFELATPLSSFLVAFVAFTFASLASLALLAPSITAPRHLGAVRWSFTSSLPTVFVMAVRVLLLFVAVEIIGSTRVLIATGAVAPIVCELGPALSHLSAPFSGLDRRRAVRAMLIVFIATWLIAYDSTGGRAPSIHAERVRRQMMRSRAGQAVGSRLHDIADRYRPALGRSEEARDRILVPLPRSGPQLPNAGNEIDLPVRNVEEEDGSSDIKAPPPASEKGEDSVREVDDEQVGDGGGGDDVEQPASDVASGTGNPLPVPAATPPGHGANDSEKEGRLVDRHSVGERSSSVSAVGASRKLELTQFESNVTPGKMRRRLLTVVRQGRAFFDGTKTPSEIADGVGGGLDPASKELNLTSLVPADVSLAEGFVGVSMAVLSFMGTTWEVEGIAQLAGEVGTTVLANALTAVGASALLLPFAVFTSSFWPGSERRFVEDVYSQADWNTLAFAVLFLICPQLMLGEERGNPSEGRAHPAQVLRRDSKEYNNSNRSARGLSRTDPVLGVNIQPRHALAQYVVVLFTVFLVRLILGLAGFDIIPYSFSLWLATIAIFTLLYVNYKAPSDLARTMARQGLTSGGNGPLLSIGRASRGSLSAIPRVQRRLGAALSRMGSFVAQSRSHEASWQVFNFLVMQSCMVVVETSYAFVTDSVGLVSISADNLFCCLALAAGLFAIRITASLNKPSARFSFGLARLESLCGFVNGILLLVVAILLLLEAIDRVVDPELIDSNHIFAVCLVGVIGNGLGLVFFPPESRRENHNVQSIYLHIWANTLAYMGISTSAIVLELNPEWRISELVVAFVVAAAVMLSSVPLLIRSSRLLLNLPAAERVADIKQTRSALGCMDGVAEVPEFRVWNLTPTSMVLTLHLVLERDAPVDDQDVLRQARSLCLQLGAPASQTTIQITRQGDAPLNLRSCLGSFDVEASLVHPSAVERP